jgi:hypothetical protein
MTPAETYRKMAADLLAKAMEAPAKPTAIQYEALAQAYIRLAEQAELNSHQDLWFEFVPKTAQGRGRCVKAAHARNG